MLTMQSYIRQWGILACAAVFLSSAVLASGYFGEPKDEFLKLDDAFKSTAKLLETSVEVSWEVAPRYYLYEKQFRFQVQDVSGKEIAISGRPKFSPAGIERHDEFMGQVMTFSDVVDISIPVRYSAESVPTQVRVDFQGCAEGGLCYPPSTRILELKP